MIYTIKKLNKNSLIGGIDEAGRGSVIGPLVIAHVAAEQKTIDKLVDIGVKDSKQINKDKRSAIYEKLMEMELDIKIAKIDAHTIDESRKSINLNEIELINMAELAKNTSLKKLYVDACSVNERKFGNDLKREIGMPLTIISENKADENYPVVSAASIVAKVKRDAFVEEIKKIIGENFGSGYPSDPKTVKYLKSCDDNEYIRKSWRTVSNKSNRSLDDYV